MGLKKKHLQPSKCSRKLQGQLDPDRIDSFKIKLGAAGDVPITIRTSLTKEDIRSLPLLAFHGAKAADMKYFDDGGVFYGHFVFQDVHGSDKSAKEFLEKLFDGNWVRFMKMFFQGATYPALKEFESSGHKEIRDEGNFPLVLVMANPVDERQTTMASVGRDDLTALIRLSRVEMDQILEKAFEIQEGEPGWKLGRIHTLMHGLYQTIVQKIVEELEQMARSAAEDKG